MSASFKKRGRLTALIALSGLVFLGIGIPVLLYGPATDRTMRSGIVRAAARDSYTLSSPVVLTKSPRLVLEQGTISLVAGGKKNPGTGEALYALLSGGGADLVLDNAVLSLGGADKITPATSGDRDVVPAVKLGPMATALGAMQFKRLTVRGGTLRIWRQQGADETLSGVSAQFESRPGKSLTAIGSANLRGEELTFNISFPKLNVKPGTPLPLVFSLKGKSIIAQVDGRLQLGDRPQLTSETSQVSIANLRHAAHWLGAHWPAGAGLREFTVKGPLDWSNGTVSFENATVSLDGNTGQGGISLALGAENRPTVTGTLAFEAFHLDPYLKAAPQDKSALAQVGDWLSVLRTEGTASPSLIREVDADLRISAASIRIADRALGRCAASVSIKDSKLRADLAEIELDQGGIGEGQFGVDMTAFKPVYSARATMKNLDVSEVLGPHLGPAAISGYGQVALDLSGEGHTGDAVVASLNGTVSLEMPEGGNIGLDLEGLTKAASDPAHKPADTNAWRPFLQQQTQIDSLVARFAVTGGVVAAQAVSAERGDQSVIAAGAVDLDNRALDITVSIARASPDGSSANKSDLAAIFRVQGPWRAPDVSVEPIPGRSPAPGETAPWPVGAVPPRDRS
jgi:AsmA protein